MSIRTIRKVKYGNTERMTFAKIDEVIDMPPLIEVQKASYRDFIENGIGEVLADASPITDQSNRIELHFLDYKLEDKPKYSEKDCKDRDATYAVPLKVNIRQIKTETGELLDQEVYMGEFPLMTPNGSFIINGAERVVVSQLVRSPGVYFDYEDKDKKRKIGLLKATNIPSRGAWLEFVEDSKGILWVQVDRVRKVQASVLLRVLSSIVNSKQVQENDKRAWLHPGVAFSTDEEILALFNNDPTIKATLEKDPYKLEDQALLELNKKLKGASDASSVDSCRTFFELTFFDRRKYDLSRVGRHKFNKKLALSARLTNQMVASDVIDADGVVYAKEGDVISEELAIKIQNAGINEVAIIIDPDEDKQVFTIMGNSQVQIDSYIDVDPLSLGVNEMVHYPLLCKYIEEAAGDKEYLHALIKENLDKLICRHIIIEDVFATINYTLGLKYGGKKYGGDMANWQLKEWGYSHYVGYIDDIDHLGNRRVRSVGELLQNEFRGGVAKLNRVVCERIQSQNEADVTPQSLVNIRPVTSAIKSFFGSSQLSQFMDGTNPIAELTHKRKISALGPGGLNRERAGFDVRDVHYTHYSRMCPIETPEGQNIGLISSLSSYARVNEYGFIEAPYRKVDKETGRVTDEVRYLAVDEEDRYSVAQANEPLDENGHFVNKRILMRHLEDISERDYHEIDYVDVSPRQMISVATALIPFLENDDTNRALMGSNMQRQAVPLLCPETPIVGTGIEHKIAYDSGVMVVANKDGVVDYVDADEIIILENDGNRMSYKVRKFTGSNQGTCMNQHPIVSKGDSIKAGQVIADGHSTKDAELALGRNILIGFMAWEGYNYEDAILINEKIVKDDVFTSIHIEEHELEARDTTLGPEEITRDIASVGEDALRNLDEDGIIRVGSRVKSGDILVGKVTPKGETDLAPEERLLRAIFGDKSREVRDTSLRVPNGEGGVVVDVKVFTRAQKDEMSPGVHKLVRVYIAQKRKISVGDKMAGRHGNKGVISRILPEEDMPFMADGTPLQIVLNPLGVPSRMNIGQVLEVHLGLVAKSLGWKVATPVFDGANENDISKLLFDNGFVNAEGKVDGKIPVYDGRTGELFENPATVGYMYMIKLIHLVDDKIHARSTGPYSLVTQQPLGGKAQFGGQRFGEMEVWALYAYGAANILQEIMTVKSDDVVGRVKTYESIIKGLSISEPSVPESFKVLIKEFQALGLDVKVLNEDNVEIGMKDLIEDEGEVAFEDTRVKHIEDGQINYDKEVDLYDDTFFDDELSDEEDAVGDDLFSFDDMFDEEEEVEIADPFADRIITDEELSDDLDDLDDLGDISDDDDIL